MVCGHRRGVGSGDDSWVCGDGGSGVEEKLGMMLRKTMGPGDLGPCASD